MVLWLGSMTLSTDRITKHLRDSGLDVVSVITGLSDDPEAQPTLVIDHQSYPGVEAHIVTAAHSALWIPKLNNNGDIILYSPRPTRIQERTLSWERLLQTLSQLSELLHSYRTQVTSGVLLPKALSMYFL